MKRSSTPIAFVIGFLLIGLTQGSTDARPLIDGSGAPVSAVELSPEVTRGDVEQAAPVAPGEKWKVKGVIIERTAEGFVLRDEQGRLVNVRVSESTKVKEKKLNPFRQPKLYQATDLLPGLYVVVKGRGDEQGALVAETVKFTQDQLKVARIIQSRVLPVENRLGQAEKRLTTTEQRVTLTERAAQRLSGEVSQLGSELQLARRETRAVRETAETAMAGVRRTNERISALDEYEAVQVLTVYFAVGSAELTPRAKDKLDRLAASASHASGYMIEVTGFASADGPEEYNRRLSQRRAEAVVRYLVTAHSISLRRILMPFGYGESRPVADNSTVEGRRKNRRVEVRLLVNRGLVMTQ